MKQIKINFFGRWESDFKALSFTLAKKENVNTNLAHQQWLVIWLYQKILKYTRKTFLVTLKRYFDAKMLIVVQSTEAITQNSSYKNFASF